MDKRVLIVHPEQERCLALAAAFRRAGWDVAVAADAVVAMGVARRERPDVALVAYRLPGGSGPQVVERLRCNAATAVTPVVGVVATDDERDLMLAAGAQECVGAFASDIMLVGSAQDALLHPPAADDPPAAAIAHPERLAAIERSRVLADPPQAVLDRYTRLVSRLLDAPAMVSIVTGDRQVFPSKAGGTDSRTQTPLSHSFCKWVVSGGEYLAVDDARTHPVLRHNPAVAELNVVSYCGTPIRGAGGFALGSLCALDSEPRAWSLEQIATLEDLGAGLAAELELHARRSAPHSAA